jgi:hypothetical protein
MDYEINQAVSDKNHRSVIIVVSGLPRSGTSMMMEMLKAGGIQSLTDDLREADIDNPRGYFEFERVKKLPEGNNTWLSDAIGKAVKIIAPLLPYLPDNYTYNVIFMRRNMEEILSSQRVMLQKKGQEPQDKVEEKIKNLYNENLKFVIKFMNDKTNYSYMFCDYNEILSSPLQCIEQIASFLDLRLDIKQMVKVVEPTLYRQRSN